MLTNFAEELLNLPLKYRRAPPKLVPHLQQLLSIGMGSWSTDHPSPSRNNRIFKPMLSKQCKIISEQPIKWYSVSYAGVTKDSALSEHGLDSLYAIEIAMQVE